LPSSTSLTTRQRRSKGSWWSWRETRGFNVTAERIDLPLANLSIGANEASLRFAIAVDVNFGFGSSRGREAVANDTEKFDLSTPPSSSLPTPTGKAAGRWFNGTDGRHIWRLALRTAQPGIGSMNFVFADFILPSGSYLLIYSPTRDKAVGPFSSTHLRAKAWNGLQRDERLWTDLLFSTNAVLYLSVPADVDVQSAIANNTLAVRLVRVNLGFRSIGLPGDEDEQGVENPFVSPTEIATSGASNGGATTTDEATDTVTDSLMTDGASDSPGTDDATEDVITDSPVANVSLPLSERAQSQPCQVDVACQSGLQSQISSVTSFVIDGQFLCSGALVSNNRNDNTPYILSAHHCIENAGRNPTFTFYWFYQAATCGGQAPPLNQRVQTQGGRILASHERSDFAILLMDDPAPSGTAFARWDNTSSNVFGQV
jgi:hypothetical protein